MGVDPARRYRLLTLLLLSLFCLASCRRKPQNTPARYAVLRFENLSGDPSYDWAGRAISESLPVALAGTLDGPLLESSALARATPVLGLRPATAPGDSSERAAALVAGANHAISGYFEQVDGKFRIIATDEDLATGRSIRTLTGTGTSPLTAIQDLARQFSPNTHAGLTSSEAALRAYSSGFEAAGQSKRDDFEQAIRLDSNFGAAWVGLASFEAATGDRAGAEDVMNRARRQKIDARSRTNLDLGDANLKGDRAAVVAATRRLVEVSPGDLVLLRNLAQAETAVGDFKSGVADWAKVTSILPNDVVAWNSLGYVRSYAGDYAGSLAAFRQYEKLRPKEANPQDSIGDLNYWFGKYAAAAESYLEAQKRQPGFQQFADVYKAAWAKFRAGDKAGADALFAQYRTGRTKSPDPLFPLLEGDWLYRTGREKEAVAALRAMTASQSGQPRADAYAQLTVWDLLAGNREEAARDSAAIGPPATPAVFLARFAALPSASVEEWKARAGKAIPAAATSLRNLAVAYALILDSQKAAAIPVWAEVVRSTTATDFFAVALYSRLQGKPVRPLLPDPAQLNQFSALLDKP